MLKMLMITLVRLDTPYATIPSRNDLKFTIDRILLNFLNIFTVYLYF